MQGAGHREYGGGGFGILNRVDRAGLIKEVTFELSNGMSPSVCNSSSVFP